MTKIVRREIRKRGFFGWVFLLIFLAFNAVMLVWLLTLWGILFKDSGSHAVSAGASSADVGATAILLGMWAAGTVVIGFFVLLTRGKKTIIEETLE